MRIRKEGSLNDDNNAAFRSFFPVLILILASSAPRSGQAATDTDNPAAVQLFAQAVFDKFKNFNSLFDDSVRTQLRYCVDNVDADWKAAFDFSKDTEFLSNCVKQTKGDIMQRLCTASEMKFYASSIILDTLEDSSTKSSNYVKPNMNCNLSSWVPGCEPGWACSVGKDVQVDLKNSNEIPFRTLECQPCCEGFFCPHGLTCMIPCPLGSYCPTSKLNETTAVCDPYSYQLPPGDTNHTCGGADVWVDFVSSSDLFCKAGFYCPTTTQKNPCSRGY
nr:ABC transporter G family member 28-like [Ipomoea batatas]